MLRSRSRAGNYCCAEQTAHMPPKKSLWKILKVIEMACEEELANLRIDEANVLIGM